jgi:DNA polymerase zeta
VVLKFEKVYLPCILVTKKRYVGFAFESEDQLEPSFDAKGIEVVRRDQCPITIKMQEKSLRMLFQDRDVSAVKEFLCRQWTKILAGRTPVRDFVLCKEVRLGTYAGERFLPPAAVVSSKAMMLDPMAEPVYGERVPYIVVVGEPGARLMDLVLDPYQLIRRGSARRLNAMYYITKQINPALRRVLSLAGIDVEHWFQDMPKPPSLVSTRRVAHRGSVITRYYLSVRCEICGVLCRSAVCDICKADGQRAAAVTHYRLAETQKALRQLSLICANCCATAGLPAPDVRVGAVDVEDTQIAAVATSALPSTTQLAGPDGCVSLDCPVFYEVCRLLQRRDEHVCVVEEMREAF